MNRALSVAALLICLASPRLLAHPAPFSYLDVRLDDRVIRGSLVLHNIDLAHELGVDPEVLLHQPQLDARRDAIVRLVKQRLIIERDGDPIDWGLEQIAPMADRDSVRLAWTFGTDRMPGQVHISARLFPYDPNHQTFVNVYERDDVVRQEVLDRSRTVVDFYSGTAQGRLAVFRTFTASGIHHIAIGPDHILFVVGLLLLGGPLSRLLLIVSAFTVGHSITLSLATLGILQPPAHMIEPAIALSIVYVGADNLLVGEQGRDTRPWIALFFGLVHGFGFASVLRETGLPNRSIGLSLFAFNLGVEIGQAIIVVVVTAILTAIRNQAPVVFKRIAIAGSVVVILAGAYWFVERVF